jgi:hypothetical protein
MTKQKHPVKEQVGYRIYSQYVLIGAALGLYYGISYHNPQTPPDFFTPILLSIIAAIVTTAVRSWKKGRTFTAILLDFLKVLALFLVYLVSLEMRAMVEGLGGHLAVVIFMTVAGMISGLIFAIQRKPSK